MFDHRFRLKPILRLTLGKNKESTAIITLSTGWWPDTQSLASDSAIGLHLYPACTQYYDDSSLSILPQGRSPFHLTVLETTFIKTSSPALCQEKAFMYVQLKDYALVMLSHRSFFSQSRFEFFS